MLAIKERPSFLVDLSASPKQGRAVSEDLGISEGYFFVFVEWRTFENGIPDL